MPQIQKTILCDGVQFQSVQDTRFKTMRISVHFLLPLQQKSAASNALLPFLLTRACRDYPDYTRLSRRLAELYGASVSADVSKLGDVQVMTITASGIADVYCFDGEQISRELAELICQMVFEPPFDAEGNFREEDFRQEKRQMLETMEAEFNDKRAYAKQRCEEILCAEEAYGIGRFGSKTEVQALDRTTLRAAWKQLITSARVEVMVLGNCNPEQAAAGVAAAFRQQNRTVRTDYETKIVLQAGKIKEVTEEMQVAQSKLVLGLRTGTDPDSDQKMVTRVMTALFGGTPHSKLFLNVREKLSLCYYCSAQYHSEKGIMLVQSGVQTQNLEAAQNEILAQLDEVKRGNFTEEEIISTKLSLCNSYRTIQDYLGGTETWYFSQVFRQRTITPEEAVEQVNAVTRAQIIEAANRVTLDTVYRLKGKEEA